MNEISKVNTNYFKVHTLLSCANPKAVEAVAIFQWMLSATVAVLHLMCLLQGRTAALRGTAWDRRPARPN
jgi:hypothetical protein